MSRMKLAGKGGLTRLEHSSLHFDAEGIMEWLSGAEEETGGPLALQTGRGGRIRKRSL